MAVDINTLEDMLNKIKTAREEGFALLALMDLEIAELKEAINNLEGYQARLRLALETE